MSSIPFGATIDLTLRPSIRALAATFWVHIGVLTLMLVALRPGMPMAVLAAAMALSWLYTRRHPAFGFGRRALTRLTWHAAGNWTLEDATGARFEAELLGTSLVHDRLLVLNFRAPDGRRRTRALLGDEAPPEPLRRLRARLRAARGA